MMIYVQYINSTIALYMYSQMHISTMHACLEYLNAKGFVVLGVRHFSMSTSKRPGRVWAPLAARAREACEISWHLY